MWDLQTKIVRWFWNFLTLNVSLKVFIYWKQYTLFIAVTVPLNSKWKLPTFLTRF